MSFLFFINRQIVEENRAKNSEKGPALDIKDSFAGNLAKKGTMKYYAYMLRCADDTIYSGYTTDLTRRLNTHNCGAGAKYTRPRLPVTLAYYEAFETKQEAMKREAAFKKLSRSEKLLLIQKFSFDL